ncbi:hypothetical protein Tco_0139787 [Tanacetum coccineum]
MYDVGVYDSDDDENGMSDFLSEMAELMSQNKPAEKREESMSTKDLFDEDLFQSGHSHLIRLLNRKLETIIHLLFKARKALKSNKQGPQRCQITQNLRNPEFQILHRVVQRILAVCHLEGVGTRERGLRERGGANMFSSSFGLPFRRDNSLVSGSKVSRSITIIRPNALSGSGSNPPSPAGSSVAGSPSSASPREDFKKSTQRKTTADAAQSLQESKSPTAGYEWIMWTSMDR